MRGDSKTEVWNIKSNYIIKSLLFNNLLKQEDRRNEREDCPFKYYK